MTSLGRLLRRPSADSIKDRRDQAPAVMEIDDEGVDEVFAALSSTTARRILTALYDQPRTASDVADEVDTSLQNVNYHLNNLGDVDLVEVVETWYSDQGTEMKVYAPTNGALVLFAGEGMDRSSVVAVLKRVTGLLGLFALISIVVDHVVRRWIAPLDPVASGGQYALDHPWWVSHAPGVLFFLGAVLALFVVAVWWSHRAVRSP